MKTAAIIPALNEYQHLPDLVAKVEKYVDAVIVVDDGSKRPLATVVPATAKVTVLRHKINLGKGASMKTGILMAQQLHCDAVVFLDADGQHDPAEIPKLCSPLQNGSAQIVFGVRAFHGSMPIVAKLGNIFLTKILQFLFGVRVHDTQSGFRAFLLSVYPQLAWTSPRYAVETEMIVNAGKAHIRFQEVDIQTIYLDKYRGTTLFDGMRIFLNMLTWRLR